MRPNVIECLVTIPALAASLKAGDDFGLGDATEASSLNLSSV